jgi:hypothetical protein
MPVVFVSCCWGGASNIFYYDYFKLFLLLILLVLWSKWLNLSNTLPHRNDVKIVWNDVSTLVLASSITRFFFHSIYPLLETI